MRNLYTYIMPLGLSWPKYLTFLSVSLLSMFVGAQAVHEIYKPLSDFPEYVERERQKVFQTKGNEEN
ncbi:hypothetical protein CDAR_423281 [Caerostris darwini]|uniref:Uncharacterized protein n=1 Tax=Caerostris darwini TaxID=1538125 RepID=A0AAV4URT0_9ARAC|nr:hypothetical protein CDAR_423281 [Caerostris darwini]